MRASGTMAKPTGILKATGRERQDWFSLLDRWGAAGRPFREIADYLKAEHGLSHWWAQKIIVEYEQARGIRKPGVRPDGTFTVTASKTVSVPVDRLVEAFTNAGLRRRWLRGSKMRRIADHGRSVRFEWEGGPSRVAAVFNSKGRSKAEVGVAHELLPDEESASATKTFWRERLTELKSLLEG